MKLVRSKLRLAMILGALVVAGGLARRGAIAVAGPTFASVLETHRAPVEAQVRRLEALREVVKQLPPLEEDAISHPGEPMVLVRYRPTDTIFIHAEDLAEVEVLRPFPTRLSESKLTDCAAYVRSGHVPAKTDRPAGSLYAPSGETALDAFDICEAARTVVVLRTNEFIAPSGAVAADAGFVPDLSVCAGGADAGVAPTSSETRYVFAGGSVRGEVLVFDLETARFEGGFRVEVRSAPRLPSTNAQDYLVESLRDAVYDGLVRVAPGTRVER